MPSVPVYRETYNDRGGIIIPPPHAGHELCVMKLTNSGQFEKTRITRKKKKKNQEKCMKIGGICQYF